MLYRNVDRPTNVLAFPNSNLQNPECFNDVKHKLLGDIVISFETIKKESNEVNKPFKDHTAHMVTHGMLHLLGFDHDTNKNAIEMEALEIEILKKLGFPQTFSVEVLGFLFLFKSLRFPNTLSKTSVFHIFSETT